MPTIQVSILLNIFKKLTSLSCKLSIELKYNCLLVTSMGGFKYEF